LVKITVGLAVAVTEIEIIGYSNYDCGYNQIIGTATGCTPLTFMKQIKIYVLNLKKSKTQVPIINCALV
jgi:hypothetical protein